MSFGTYVAEEGDAWIDAVEKTAEPIEEFLTVADDPDDRQQRIEDLGDKLRSGKFFVLVAAKNGVDVLLLPGKLDEEQIDQFRSLFDKLELAEERELATKIRSLRPKPYEPAVRGHDGQRLSAQIQRRLDPQQETADEFFLLQDAERITVHRNALFKRLVDLHGQRARYDRLLAVPMKNPRTGRTYTVCRVQHRWRHQER
jgi:hypothetical protein